MELWVYAASLHLCLMGCLSQYGGLDYDLNHYSMFLAVFVSLFPTSGTFWLALGILVVSGWLLLSLWAFSVARRAFKKYRNYPRMEVGVNMEPSVRADFGKWDEAEITRGCFLRFPLHCFMVSSFLVGYTILAYLQTFLKYPDWLINLFRTKYGRFAMRVVCHLAQEFQSGQVTTPIIIANHVSWIDFIYMGTCITKASFVAKKEVQQVPIFNALAYHLKSLWVDRSSAEARHNIKEQIGQRVEQYRKDPASMPIIIYPQGTVTNGRSVISFKNGAFEPLCPVTIFSLKYESKWCHLGLDEVSSLEHAVLALSLNFTLRVRKAQLAPLDSDTVEAFRERCRDKLVEISGFKKYDSDLREILDYEKKFKEFLKQRRANPTANESQ